MTRKIKVLLIIIISLLIGILYFYTKSDAQVDAQDNKNRQEIIKGDDLYSESAILLDSKGNVMMEKNSQEKMRPASITKVMSAIVALEANSSLEKEVIIDSSLYSDLFAQNASIAGFNHNERTTIRDLLYGMMLPSGADATLTLVDESYGSEKAFVKMMNNKAKELGMDNTHFTNSYGIDEKGHYSTCEDLGKLMMYALENEDFKTIVSKKNYSIQMHDFESTTFKRFGSTKLSNGELLGGKTGYTSDAGLCLASYAKVNGDEYIFISLKAKGNQYSKQYNMIDARNIYNSIK
ncbi:MAG: serine hydrolase [Erysipelotrichales bacterium]